MPISVAASEARVGVSLPTLVAVRLRRATLCLLLSLTLAGCHMASRAETKAEKLCHSQFGIATRRFAPGTVAQVRALPHSAFRHAFPNLPPSATVA